ncbi:YolD-like family protein [Bacillus sp. ISL-7]|uniref:YolD-like family protein n=1 Tax=Bacillus sp. ISL-7 TaxID=2819136 RepID=UPI001BEBBED2|nr:YolD-like family protein [Bacillus sp. ISL-7]MBT2735630.1 YolD-like family protein [Bacillus sp. ISL-7]
MAICDRGIVKWQAAFQLPELVKSYRGLWRDTERIAKPIIDEHEAEEFDQRIAYAMESNYAVKITIWQDGFTTEITGRIHRVDPITHQLRIEVKPGEFEWVAFEEVTEVTVVD